MTMAAAAAVVRMVFKNIFSILFFIDRPENTVLIHIVPAYA
jgi:hypothetical protein